VELQDTAAGDEVHTPPREFQVLLLPYSVYWSAPDESTAKMYHCPVLDEEAAAGPVPGIVWPLTLAALLTTAKSETSIRVAKTMLIVVRL
jgi:hypothetical protein